MKKISHFLRWVWVYIIPLGLLSVLLSVGFFMSGLWLTVFTLNELPLLVAWYGIMGVLALMTVLFTGATAQAIWKMVKIYRARYL